MPKLHAKRTVLGGRAEIICYERDKSSWYIRVYDGETRSYRTTRLQSASTLIEAFEQAPDTYLKLTEETLKPRRGKQSEKRRPTTIREAASQYLKSQWELVQHAKTRSQSTYEKKERYLRNGIIPYLEANKIANCTQINEETWKRYPAFRESSIKSKLTLDSELSEIGSFVKWLVKKKLCKVEAAQPGYLPRPKITNGDLLANPAINDNDWELIKKRARASWYEERTKDPSHWRAQYFAKLMYEWLLIMYNTGARPEELLKTRWKDYEIVNIGRFSASTQHERIQELTELGVDIDSYSPAELQELGKVDWEIVNVRLSSSKLKGEIRYVSAPINRAVDRWANYIDEYIINQNKAGYELPRRTANTLVFGNIWNDFKPFSYQNFHDSWNQIVRPLEKDFQGHWLSDENYTPYSMRSSFIENQLMQGKDLFLIAKAAGHSIKTLMEHYERCDMRKRGGELADFRRGKRNLSMSRKPGQSY